MKKIGLYGAKTKLSSLVAEIEATGEKVQLTRHGKVVAELCPASSVSTPVRGCLKSENFFIAEDFDTVDMGFEDMQGVSLESPMMVAEEEAPYGEPQA